MKDLEFKSFRGIFKDAETAIEDMSLTGYSSIVKFLQVETEVGHVYTTC